MMCQHSTPVDSVLKIVNTNWIGAQYASTPTNKRSDWLDTPIQLLLTHSQHRISWCWHIMRTESTGVDTLWEPNRLALTHSEHRISWCWHILSTKSVGVDTFWAPLSAGVDKNWRVYSTRKIGLGPITLDRDWKWKFRFYPDDQWVWGQHTTKICFRDRVPLKLINHVMG